jgi:hypothetical protein
MRTDIAVLLDVVPGGGMADVVDRDIVVLAPEKRDRGIALAAALAETLATFGTLASIQLALRRLLARA